MNQVKNVIDILNSLEGIEYGWMDIEKNTHINTDKGYKKKRTWASGEPRYAPERALCMPQSSLIPSTGPIHRTSMI